jgi:hypothetical protein
MPRIEFELDYGSGFAIVDPPKNSQKMKIQLVWTNGFPNATVSGIDFIWVGKNAKNMWARKKSGITGGLGITEGVGLRAYMWCRNTRLRFIDGYVDLANNRTKWERDSVAAPTIETGKIDQFNNVIQSIPFDYLAGLPVGAQGRIIPTLHYKKIPYCVVKLSHAPLQEAIVALGELAVLKMGLEAFRDISSLTTKATGDAATATATLGAATPTIVATVIEIGVDVAYLSGCVITILLEIKKVIDSIWQTKKYKLGMLERDHWKLICDYQGLQFASPDIYAPTSKDYNATWIPKKTVIPDVNHPLTIFTRPYDEIVNFPNNPKVYGHYDGLASSFVKTMCDKYNGACSIKMNPTTGVRTLYFTEKHYWNTQSVFTIPNTIEGNGYAANAPEPYGTNLMDLPWNYLLAYATDPTDEQTERRYQGTTWSKNISQTIVGNKSRITRGKGVVVNLECALAKRKDYLSNVENLVNNLTNFAISLAQDVLNAEAAIYNGIVWIINLFGGNVQPITPFQLPTNLINNRLGWLEITDDKFSVPKSFIGIAAGGDWKIHPNNATWSAAERLGNDYHVRNLPTHGAQQDKYKDKKFKFCCPDYLNVLEKNVVSTLAGHLGNLESLEWELETEEATSDYGIYSVETNNLTEKTTVDGN